MDYTKAVGNITELQCLSKFMEMGFDCSIPYGDASKYDFIADLNGELVRIQCKASRSPTRKDGTIDTEAFTFSCLAQTTNTQKTVRHRYSNDDIDYFATFFNNNVYVIPVEECSTAKTLRLSPPNNGQSKYNKAEDYLIEKMFGYKQNQAFLEQKESRRDIVIEKKEILCSQCHKNLVSIEGGICRECVNFNSRKVARPSREELKKMIREKPFLEIGRCFNVTDNAIRKWCKAENLPTRKSEIKKYSDADWSNL